MEWYFAFLAPFCLYGATHASYPALRRIGWACLVINIVQFAYWSYVLHHS